MTQPDASPTSAEGGNPAGGQPAGGAPAGGQPVEWTANLPDEAKTYVQNKGWKSPDTLLESYRNLEKLVGLPAERVVKLPKSDAAPEEWGPVWERLGRPANPDGYGLSVPEGGDARFTDWAKTAFHKNNVPKEMGLALVKDLTEFSDGLLKAESEARELKSATEATALKKEWGAAHDQNINMAKFAAAKLGIDAETIDALEDGMGFAKVMRLFHDIGSRMGEGDFVGGDTTASFNGAMAPAAAHAAIGELMKDKEFTQKYLSGEVMARKKMEQLHVWAAGG